MFWFGSAEVAVVGSEEPCLGSYNASFVYGDASRIAIYMEFSH